MRESPGRQGCMSKRHGNSMSRERWWLQMRKQTLERRRRRAQLGRDNGCPAQFGCEKEGTQVTR